MTQNEALELIVKTLDSKKSRGYQGNKDKGAFRTCGLFRNSRRYVKHPDQALADEVEFRLKEAGLAPNQIQGNNGSNWIVLDYGDIIVHVFSRDQRDFYNLERLWRDGEEIDISSMID